MPARFGEFQLDEQLFTLRRAGAEVPLTPRVHDLLRYLVTHRDRVVTKQELMAAVWAGARVCDNALAQSIRELRRALGESATESGTIQTIRGRGYRFVADVSEEQHAVKAPPPHAPVDAPTDAPLLDRASILEALRARF